MMVTVHVAMPSSICSRHSTTIYTFVPIIIGQYLADFFQANMCCGVALLEVILESTEGHTKGKTLQSHQNLYLGTNAFFTCTINEASEEEVCGSASIHQILSLLP
jgi:hypothetical protein